MSTFNACRHIFWNTLTLYGVTTPRDFTRFDACGSRTRREFLRHPRIDLRNMKEATIPATRPALLTARHRIALWAEGAKCDMWIRRFASPLRHINCSDKPCQCSVIPETSRSGGSLKQHCRISGVFPRGNIDTSQLPSDKLNKR